MRLKENILIAIQSSFCMLSAIIALTGCANMSETVKTGSNDLNGGFESFERGLPVNWSVYSPAVVKKSDFIMMADPTKFVEGKQSLMFDVKKCSDKGGHFSPGFCREFFEGGSGRFMLTGKVLNENGRFRLSAGAVNAQHGSMMTLLEETNSTLDWQSFSFEVDVPQGSHLRIEFNVLSAGIVHIDDVNIEKL